MMTDCKKLDDLNPECATIKAKQLCKYKFWGKTRINMFSVTGETYSNTELSFWSPQIRISVIERIVSTRRLRLWSVTVVFFVKT